jgi:hypothetical protein
MATEVATAVIPPRRHHHPVHIVVNTLMIFDNKFYIN